MRLGWIIYALGVPAAVLSVILQKAGKAWYLSLGGVLYAVRPAFGTIGEIALPLPWRSPIYPPVFLTYVTLFLGPQVLYWWPLGTLSRPSWFIYAAAFAVSTILNVTSHAWVFMRASALGSV